MEVRTISQLLWYSYKSYESVAVMVILLKSTYNKKKIFVTILKADKIPQIPCAFHNSKF